VNWQHFRALVWLRWRLRVNQMKRGGLANVIILALLAAGGVLLVIFLFVALFAVGLLALPQASPWVLLYVWDGLTVVFLFLWTIGLLTDLQRSEALSLQKFLHLPVSLENAFLINYFSSLFSLNLLLFVPATVGLSLGLLLAKGPAMLWLFPLLAGFILMITALTYQFQGWLASLMTNPRRRRTVIVVVTAVFILVCQLPNLVNIVQPWGKKPQDKPAVSVARAEEALQRSLESGKLTRLEYQKRKEAMELEKARAEELKQQRQDEFGRTARLINLCLPPGWLALGAMASAQGDFLSPLVATLGLALIGSASLWRSYRTTVRLYTGQFTAGKRSAAAPAVASKAAKPPDRLLEKQLPGLSEQASAITLSSLRSLTRAPEAKMVLLTPIILVVVFGAMLAKRSINLPEAVRPLLVFGAMSMMLLTMVQIVGNQFGFDRSGFRVFVLCAARRRDILLGKNLAVAPLALGLGTTAAGLLQALYPMRLEHFFAALPQLVSMYFVFCLVANLLAILAPMPIASGSLKPVNPKLIPVLLHLVFVFFLPLAMAPTLLPLGIELLLEELGLVKGLPVCLVFSLVECIGVVWVYSLLLAPEGALLHYREQKILEIVTSKTE
jgi:hypothetical protein